LLRRILLLLIVVISFGSQVVGQNPNNRTENLPYYDQRPFHYGIILGVNASMLKLEYSDLFLDSVFIHSITPRTSLGLAVGGVINFRAAKFLDIRTTPTVGFYEYSVDYNYTNRPKENQQVSTVNIELPVLLKYKSERRNNIRMYVIGGVKPSFEASGRREQDEEVDQLRIKGTSLSIEYGFGLDIYYPLFKFSPEIRISQGMSNVFQPETHRFSSTIRSLQINTVSLFLIFQ
jgi:hypothetical protein